MNDESFIRIDIGHHLPKMGTAHALTKRIGRAGWVDAAAMPMFSWS